MRVLLVKTSSMGDVIHALPAVTDAAQAIPGVMIDWVVEEGFAEIPRWHPAVQEVIPVAIRRWRKAPLQAIRSGEWRQFRERLSAHRYDAVIDAQGLLKSALVARLVTAPRYGYSRDTVRESLASFFYQHRFAVSRQQHAIERIRELFSRSLGYARPTATADYGLPRERFATPMTPSPTLVFLHGTAREEKCWPVSHWIALGQAMARAGHTIGLPWGNAIEQQRAQAIADAIGEAARVFPKMRLQEVAAVIAAAKAVVAVDTGLGHLTAALAVPCLSLYGPTDPALIGARGQHQQALQAADGDMASLLPQQAEHALRSMLGATS
ncbi:MAG: lipopolysaccharide heptosyltransferase I [Gammaproteobacteria bacterium]|nr:MAG: lipopolysaccharide heptosyltransferase I [Gammaproteobacteria bacterium]